MFVTAYDANRVILVSIHLSGEMTDADVDKVCGGIDTMAKAIDQGKAEFATNIVLAEADSGPSAKQRKRIGEATKKLTHSFQVVVTQSAVIRAVATAIRWFSQDDKQNVQKVLATWPEARLWLVQQTQHPPDVLDALVAQARRDGVVR